MAQKVRFFINIPAEEYLHYYRGRAQDVVTTATDGRRIRFPARILRPYMTPGGVRGEFILWFDDNNRFLRIEKVQKRPPRT